MTPERWQQIRDVLEKALDLKPELRSAFLNQACSSDPSLRQEVETLLASSDHVRSSFLESPPETVRLAAGTKLGEYEVKSLLGSGGMGEVYRARDSRLNRDVAIKVLPSVFFADTERLRRFEQEARAAAALNHPNILAVYQMGTHAGAPYLVSELLEGETLGGQLKRGRMVVRKAIDYAVQMARGLAAAHEKGIVHRDLKPENLFVTKDGRVKILDFGLAKLTERQAISDPGAPTVGAGTESGVVMGTVGYMAPEQVRGERADHRADIFAFGAILYEMLVGTRAFQKATSVETMTAILNEDPPSISQVTTNVPAALQRVVHRCLEKSTEQRFQSASDLAFALDALSESSSSGTPFPEKNSEGSGSPSFATQHKLGLVAGVVLFGLVFGAVLYSMHRFRSNSVPPVKITHKQFTFSGDAYWPAISPDGLFVAYTKYNPVGKSKLMVQAQNGTEAELAQGVIGNLRWSPDGAEVLFVLFSKEKSAPSREENSTSDIGVFVVSRLGGVARRIDKGDLACWANPNGSEIITGGTEGGTGTKGVRLVSRISGEVREVSQPEYTWLNDLDCSPRAGLVLAVVQTLGKFRIRIFKPDGSSQRNLLEANDQISSARWSPTGDAIYYLHGEGSTQELSRVPVIPGHPSPAVLADGLQTGGYFTLSADGSRLAYTREDSASNLWRVDLPIAGKRTKPEISQTTTGTSYHGEPSFSPDGRWIAFALGPNPDETNVFKMSVAGGAPVQLTFFERAGTASPAWSPDGQRIAFISDQDHTPRVWTVGENGGNAKPFENTNASDTDNKLAWWPNRDIVYQQPGIRDFLQVSGMAKEEKNLIQQDQSVGWLPLKPAFSPDGKKIAVWWNRKDSGLWIISLEPYSKTLLVPGLIFPSGWSPDGKAVYAIRRKGGGADREIVSVKVATPSEITSIVTLPGDVIEHDGATISPDGKQIFVSVDAKKSDVWLMENFDPSTR
jgi:serine/threonine protein kinase/WD40 repeat protein